MIEIKTAPPPIENLGDCVSRVDIASRIDYLNSQVRGRARVAAINTVGFFITLPALIAARDLNITDSPLAVGSSGILFLAAAVLGYNAYKNTSEILDMRAEINTYRAALIRHALSSRSTRQRS